ncbi:hypothetical protein [Paraflavitalea speifideaquila]|uniref:hypothetical protein n=1 Tax=Paraflavitalea speifideaquila TaxID=3076558 RepID=UPI0028EA7C81|nr:hypothetical protein [Paraflavitalea speifideiaquila]
MIKTVLYTILHTVILTVLIFICLTELTSKRNAAVDSIDSYGYPYVFYDYFGGKCIDNCYERFGFHSAAFLNDIGFAAILALAGVLLSKILIARIGKAAARKTANR